MEQNPEAVLPVIRAVLAKAPAVNGVQTFRAQYRLQALKALCDKALEGLDCVVTPTIGRPVTLAELDAEPVARNDRARLVVCGAHLDALALNWQLKQRGARLVETTFSSPDYQLYALAGGPPFRPGMVRVTENGVAIAVEVWELPSNFLNVRFIPELNWYLFVDKREDSVLSEIRQSLYLNLLICLVVTLIVLALLNRVIKRYQGKIQA